MAKLIHRLDDRVIEEIELTPGTLRIGRQVDNDIRLNDLAVSGYHAQITVKPSEYLDGWHEVRVEDLGSTNGTLVNGRAVLAHNLKHEETVSIGTHEFVMIDENVLAGEQTRILIADNND